MSIDIRQVCGNCESIEKKGETYICNIRNVIIKGKTRIPLKVSKNKRGCKAFLFSCIYGGGINE
jgi:hypothetical protein